MKKLSLPLALVLLFTLALGCFSGVSAAYDRSYVAPFASAVIDGEAEEAWNTAEWTDIDKPYDGTNSSDSVVRIKLMWDDEKLYFLAEISDSDLNEENDIVEIYLDQLNDKKSYYNADDSHTRFKVSGEVVTGEQSGTNAQTDAEFKVKDLGNGKYVMEGALTWTEVTPAEGTKVGVEFMYNDGNSESDFVEAYRWNANTAAGDPIPFQDTSAFGVLILADASGIVSEEATTEPVTTPEEESTDTSVSDTSAPDTSESEDSTADTTTVPESSSESTSETSSATTGEGSIQGPSVGIIIGAVAVVIVVAVIVVVVLKKKK